MGIVSRLKKAFALPSDVRPTYDQDGLRTVHNAGFLLDEEFMKAEQLGAATGSWEKIHWRVHTILWAAYRCSRLEGDFVECGVNKGGYARAIIAYIDIAKADKQFFLLDTFKGIVPELLTKAEKAAGKQQHFKSYYTDSYSQVVKTFDAFSFVKIIRGQVPETLSQVSADKIAFLSIDMNSIVPEIAALNYFWDKIVPGGMIVLDDYAFVTCELQYEAHNKWANEKGIKILTLPTGQGLIVK
jgi:O-methyltransferase